MFGISNFARTCLLDCLAHQSYGPAHPGCPHHYNLWPCSSVPILLLFPRVTLAASVWKGNSGSRLHTLLSLVGWVWFRIWFAKDRFLSGWPHFGHLFIWPCLLRWNLEFPGGFCLCSIWVL